MNIETKKKHLDTLMRSEAFQELVLKSYLGEDVDGLVFDENLDSSFIIDELKARQKLRNFLYDIISQAEIAENEV